MTELDEIDTLKEELYGSEVVFYWEDASGGTLRSKFFVWAVSIFCAWIPFSFLFFISDMRVGEPFFWMTIIMSVFFLLITRYLFFSDKHYKYSLTQLGIHYTQKDMIPEVAYKIARGFAWVGIAVCIIAIFLLGPLAFVGAGAFALMSFKLTNFQSITEKRAVFFSKNPVLFDFKKTPTFQIDSYTEEFYRCYAELYCTSIEQKNEVISIIRRIQENIEYVELAKRRDLYKHSLFNAKSSEVSE